MQRWITLLSLALGAAVVAPATQAAPVWVTAWTASPAPDRKDGKPGEPVQFAAQTVRQDMRVGSRGDALRLRISNELGTAPLHVEDIRVRLKEGKGAAVPVTVDGRHAIDVPVGAALLSDPVALPLAALQQISVTAWFPQPTQPAVRRTVVRVADGRQDAVADSVRVSYQQNVFSAVLVQRAERPQVIVALGDSITEGATAARGSFNQWPERLGERLQQACPDRFVVLNQGISGNKLLDHGRSHSALSRLDRDVIAVAGADQVIVFEGINDIRHGGGAQPLPGRSAPDMLLGYRQLAARLHAHGIRTYLGTLTPFGGSERYEPVSATTRASINQWARSKDNGFDGVIDFDAALRDPAAPESLPADITRDHLHPNDAGYRRMADAIDLGLFGCQAPR
ncbi:GDSL-type esterase/lipase family protein [Stenotrophomonas sp. 24(2023)]|uniref:GDSL-type esterase/lipase family protein n=1 Tax=Stenotrophomonas sp. 24(2023) TaxID=3068324 RepID=UPI0027E20E57|nr:GDSL-type esterase/lipase family protein [Stenotrophomonas sp. 24(2023)]WMJ69180.1 GDSL-type esterase/lipase family protein [Stenotrophomonas sp. 24(2023)]